MLVDDEPAIVDLLAQFLEDEGYRVESALGRPFQEVWASIWDEIAP